MKIMIQLIDMLKFSSSSGRKVELMCLRTAGFFSPPEQPFALDLKVYFHSIKYF